MGISIFKKELTKDEIQCGGTVKVKLSIAAEPDITTNPIDAVLVLDVSKSMAGVAFSAMKNGAKKFIDILEKATDGKTDEQIGMGSHAGLVSFSNTAIISQGLTVSAKDIKNKIDSLSVGDKTNHEDAFKKAATVLSASTGNKKVVILFTDGNTTIGDDIATANAAKQLKDKGAVIYCIGLDSVDGLDKEPLNNWSSDPDSSYVMITPDVQELERIFEEIAQNIVKPGASNICITDMAVPCFNVKSVGKATKGTAQIKNKTTIQWKIDELGLRASEGASLEYELEHVGPCSGKIDVTQLLDYTDMERNMVYPLSNFVNVKCDTQVMPEECAHTANAVIGSCKDTMEIDAGTIGLQSLGRLLQVDVTLKNVCPRKKVALAVVVNEIDQYGNEHKRGFKTLTIPAHTSSGCKNVVVKCIKFVLPEDLDVSGSTDSICNERKFKVKTFANYIDNDFYCCQITI